MSNVVFLGPVVRALLRRTEVCVDSAIFSSVFSPPRVGGHSAGRLCSPRYTSRPLVASPVSRREHSRANSETPLPGNGQCSLLSSIPSASKLCSPMTASCTSVCCQPASAQRDTGAGDSRPPAGRERPLNSPLSALTRG